MKRPHPAINTVWRRLLWRLGVVKCLTCSRYARWFVAWEVYALPRDAREPTVQHERPIGPYCARCGIPRDVLGSWFGRSE